MLLVMSCMILKGTKLFILIFIHINLISIFKFYILNDRMINKLILSLYKNLLKYTNNLFAYKNISFFNKFNTLVAIIT